MTRSSAHLDNERRAAKWKTLSCKHTEYSAYRNLELQRILIGNPDKEICDKLLGMVGLTEVKDKKVGKFSMGMKQRLSIAMALVGKPRLLILDEPINGLDPKNISELRSLLKRLNEENDVTLFLSSHILNELYLLATDYYIIHKGRIIKSITHDELDKKLSVTGQSLEEYFLSITGGDSNV